MGVRVTLFLEQDYLRTSLKRDKATHVPIAPVPQPSETQEQALERTQWGPDDTEYKENRRILSALLRVRVQSAYGLQVSEDDRRTCAWS